uniref:Uncharacterized protein n=1 Tax=Rhizophora mucronata TaxID=61149 RepID=A0A2P2QEX5_RHIMU
MAKLNLCFHAALCIIENFSFLTNVAWAVSGCTPTFHFICMYYLFYLFSQMICTL